MNDKEFLEGIAALLYGEWGEAKDADIQRLLQIAKEGTAHEHDIVKCSQCLRADDTAYREGKRDGGWDD